VPKIAEKFEIIIINDGSIDGTSLIAERLTKYYPCVRLVSQSNKGYGGALKSGFINSKYDWIFYTDSDLQFDLKELKRFITHTDYYDLIIGYRKNRAEGWKRQIFTVALKIWNNFFLAFPLSIKDIDCGFKLLHKRVVKNASPLISDGAMLSTEILLKAYRSNFRIKQIGVSHYSRMSGKPTGNNLKVISRAVRDTFILQKHLLLRIPIVKYTGIYLKQIKNYLF
jgi:glycosyltransferase involved in cell wall biosynthesis